MATAEFSPTVQVMLLPVLQDQVFERVGGMQPIAVDVRLVAAINKHLAHEVRAGRFRGRPLLSFQRRNVAGATAA